MTVARKWIAVAAVFIVTAAGLGYWRYASGFVSTDDAYIGADVVRIAPEVGGRVASVAVTDNSVVHHGDLLVAIDETPYRIAEERAQAALQLAQDQVRTQTAAVSQAAADLDAARAQAARARQDADRDATLTREGVLARATGDAARTAATVAAGNARAANARLNAARAALSADAGSAIRVASASLAQAQLDLSHTRITAPVDGIVTGVTLRPGDMVVPGQALFALVGTQHYWVQGNFKETDLAGVHVGQRARVSLDMYPGYEIQGVVESLSPASGSSFSLLPPENATGNWVKVSQRVPVRIRLINVDPARPPVLDTSASVRIKIGS
jgi:membrane fusion protein (multidrug efflux system)